MKAKKVNRKIDELKSLLEELYRNPSRDLEDKVYRKYEEIMFEIYNDVSLLERTKAYIKSYEEGWVDSDFAISDYSIKELYSNAVSMVLSRPGVITSPDPGDYFDRPEKYAEEYGKFVRDVTKSFLFQELPSYIDKLIMNIADEKSGLNESGFISLEKAKKALEYYEIDSSINPEKLFPNRYAYEMTRKMYDANIGPYLGIISFMTAAAAGIEYGLYRFYKYLGNDYDLIRYGLIALGVVVAYYYMFFAANFLDNYAHEKSMNEKYRKFWKYYM